MGDLELLVKDISEAELLQRILSRLKPSSNALIGPGDDCAVLKTSPLTVITIDTLVEGPDFRSAWSDGFNLGWKAAAVNLADVSAMGANPTALVVALTVPQEIPINYIEQMASGLQAACDQLAPGCSIVGGDLASSNTLTVAVTALGQMPDGFRPVTRAGAEPGQIVTIAGNLGAAAAGLNVLWERFRDGSGAAVPIDWAGLSDVEAALVRAQLQPSPPIALGVVAAESGAVAMMDLSDGLGIDARRMAAASGVVIDFDSAALLRHYQRPVAELMRAGEDHGLLTVFPGSRDIPAGFNVVGRTVLSDSPGVCLDGEPYLARGGWDPYQDVGPSV